MSQGRLEFAQERGTVLTVAMDEVRFLIFGQSGFNSIGTGDLNGCSAVMIVSTYAAILGHIPPRPNNRSEDLEAGDKNVRAKMREVAALYNSNRNYFQTGGANWVVCAVFQGELALPDQQKIIQDGLAGLGLSYSSTTYVASRRNQIEFPGRGTVLVEKRGQVPVVYVEDKEVSKSTDWSSSHLRTPASVSGSSAYTSPIQHTSSRFYYVKDKNYFLYENGKHTPQAPRPKNVWVLNENGWSDGNGMKWRYWDGKNVSYSASVPTSAASVSYAPGSAGYSSGSSVSYTPGPAAYTTGSSVSYTSESTTYASGSHTSSSQGTSANQESYHYVRDKQYFLYDNGQHIAQSSRPKNVWVFNEKGWSDSDGMRWRYWDGTSVRYSK